MSDQSRAAQVVAVELARLPAADRGRFLRELLAHTAAGLVVVEGDATAAEAVYRLADAVVCRRSKSEIQPPPAA